MRNAAPFIAQQSSTTSGALPAALDAFRTALRAWRQRRQLTRLADIDDHLLADIGVTRAEVRWALDLPFSSDPGAELQRLARRDWRPAGGSEQGAA